MAATDNTPLFDPADVTTCYAGTAVTGKRFVRITGARVGDLVQVGHAIAAGVKGYGVSVQDAAAGAQVGVAHEGVWQVLAGEALTAGDLITSGAAGVAMIADTSADQILGRVVDDCANGADAFVRIGIAGARIP